MTRGVREIRARVISKTHAERVGYHVAWRKRMVRKIKRDIALLKLQRAGLLSEAESLNTAILTMERMLSVRFDEMKP